MNDTRPTIHERMISILGDLPAIGKNQKNQQQGFMFRGHDDVLNALNPLLAKHGVFVVPNVLERETAQRQTKSGSTMFEVNLHVQFTFYGESGDSVFCSTWGEGTDSGDKATNKAMTMAFKNALNQSFSISTVENKDADAETPPESTGRVAQSTGEAKGITPAPEPRNPTPGAADAAPSPVGSPEPGTAAWWDSLRAEQFVQVIGAQTDAQTLLRWLTFEGEREIRNGKKPRKGVSAALSKRIKDLDGDDPDTGVAVAPDLGGGPKGDAGEASVSPATTEPVSPPGSDSEPARPTQELLLVKAALAWIADQDENPGLWTVPNVLFGISQRGGGTFGTLEEVPEEWLGRVWEAVPDDVSTAVQMIGPEALTKLAAQAR